MEIVDSQVHLNGLPLDAAIVAMDAVGVDAILIDEFASRTPGAGRTDGDYLPDGSFRYHWPYSEAAVAAHPERFAYLVRYDPLDPELDAEIAALRSHPGRLALRVCPLPALPERPDGVPARPTVDVTQQWRDGVFEPYFASAERHGVPVFLHASNGEERPLSLELTIQAARQHPELQIIADHSGVSLPSAPGRQTADAFAQFEAVLALAEYPNIALKWCHAPRLSMTGYPFDDIRRELHRVLEAFGPERVLWASDFTVDRRWTTWAETLYTLRDDPGLDEDARSWLLGGSARSILRWPAPDPIS